MDNSKKNPRFLPAELSDQLVRNTTVHLNLAQDMIVTTEDKVRLCLINHVEGVEARRSWIAPTGILATIIATFATTTFRDFLFLEASFWKAVFAIALVTAAAWFVVALRKSLNAKSIEDVVKELKKAGTSTNGT